MYISGKGNVSCASMATVSLRIPVSSITCIHRGSYMSAHVLLSLLNKLGKRDKMRGLPSILSLFRNEFNKFNNILNETSKPPVNKTHFFNITYLLLTV